MNDERLVRRAVAGEKAAFEAIFRRYHQDLYRYCLATVGNAQDAQEALQNTMVKAMQALPGERREIRLKPWLYRVARNEAIETVRRRREGGELDAEHEATGLQTADSAEARERLRQLLADLEELPERQRSALVMRELGGLDFEEIAASFATSAAVARQTVYEARLSLRQMGEGREMSCETVMKALSDADGRVTRRRELRAHLRNCASCRAFRGEIGERSGELAAIAPLPVALSAGLLQALTDGSAAAALGAAGTGSGAAAVGAASAGTGAGGVVATVGAGVGKTVAGATIAKSVATVAVVATLGVGAADRGGVIDLPIGGKDKSAETAPQPGADPSGENGVKPVGTAGGAAPGGTEAARGGQKPAGVARSAGAASGEGSAKAKRARAAGAPGKPQAGSHPGKPPRAGGKGKAGANAGNGGPPPTPPPASSRGRENAGARKAPQAQSPETGATPPPPPAPEQPPQNSGAAATPAPSVTEAAKGGAGANGAGAAQTEQSEP